MTRIDVFNENFNEIEKLFLIKKIYVFLARKSTTKIGYIQRPIYIFFLDTHLLFHSFFVEFLKK